LLLLQHFQLLLVRGFVGNIKLGFVNLNISMSHCDLRRGTHQVLGQGSKSDDQTLHDIVTGLLKVERPGQDKQNTRNAVLVVQFNPLLELFSQPGGGDTLESNTSGLTSGLQFLGRERVDAFSRDHLRCQILRPDRK
jgi:hypothetical protein